MQTKLFFYHFLFWSKDAVSQFQSTVVAAVPTNIKTPGSAVTNRKSSQESGAKKSQLQLIAGAIKRKRYMYIHKSVLYWKLSLFLKEDYQNNKFELHCRWACRELWRFNQAQYQRQCLITGESRDRFGFGRNLRRFLIFDIFLKQTYFMVLWAQWNLFLCITCILLLRCITCRCV